MLIAFGFWYLVFWFVTTEPNPLFWGGLSKFLYLFFGFIMWNKLEDDFINVITTKKNNTIKDEQQN